MSGKYITRDGKTTKRGAFISGIWHCDCEPRMPAEKFQTKKEGKNHGRWFYTCQKAQHKRCNFFLWEDDAKIREEGAVLNNSRSEPMAAPQTPRKSIKIYEPPTPDTRSKPTPVKQTASSSALRAQTALGDVKEEFEWSSDADDDLVEALEIFETPRKTARTAQITSPGKSSHSSKSFRTVTSESTLHFSDDVFTTPSTSRPNRSGLLSPTQTPVKGNSQTCQDLDSSTLAAQALAILQPANLNSKIEEELVELLEKYELRAQGIAKGRDITRLAVQAKDRRISELQARIQGLEAEKETSRTVIGHLKHDIAISPQKKDGRKSERVERTRSEV